MFTDYNSPYLYKIEPEPSILYDYPTLSNENVPEVRTSLAFNHPGAEFRNILNYEGNKAIFSVLGHF